MVEIINKIEIALALGYNTLALKYMRKVGIENIPKKLAVQLAKVMFLEIVED